MTDANAGEMPAEQVLPIPPPAPEAPAELDAAPGHAADGLAPEADQDDRSALVDAVAAPSADATAERPLPFDVEDVEHLGILRRSVLDHMVDTDEPQSVAQILASMPAGTTRGSGESAIRREWEADRIERVGVGLYVLAKPKPPKPAEPTRPSPVAPEDEQVWLAAFEAWVVSPDSWDREKLGPRPNEPGRRIPADIVARGVDRSRKRKERRREAEAAAAKRTAADAELRDRLIAATGGNIIRTSALDDVGPIKLALELVPIDRILSSIRNTTNRKMFPKNEPARSWGEPRLLREIAENYCRTEIVPRLVDAWSKAGKTLAPTVPSSPPAGDIDRSHHDHEHSPPGPHIAGDATPNVSQEAADASDVSPAVQVPLDQENASTVPPPQPVAMPDDRPAISAEPAAVDAKPRAAPAKEAFQTTPCGSPAKLPAEPTRESIMAAFNRPRQPQPAPPQHQPAQRQAERPWFAGERQATPEPEMSDEGWEELIAGFVAGNINWNARRLGPEPGNHGCRAPQSVLRRYRL